MKNKIFSFLISSTFIFQLSSFAQQYATPYPTNWWVGMKWNKVQILLHGTDGDLSKEKISINYPGISLLKKNVFENGKYVALDIVISAAAKPGTVKIICDKNGEKHSIDWPLKARRSGNGTEFARGVSAADFIYLLIPDRFSNGDKNNDKYADMNDTACNRNDPFLRHGGDLQGMQNHLDYLSDLGVTAIWPTPLIENNTALSQEGDTWRSSYHGYHFTDQYNIDKRFGGNAAYKNFVDAAHTKGIKVIQDAVYNHYGNKHFLFLDQPDSTWFNIWPSYTNTSYKAQPLVDPYASKSDYEKSVSGWFTPFLPDVNQRNPFVAKFLIQHALWTVEEFGIDGWRVDTYFYSDKNFLNNINKALYTEYPKISIFGEVWVYSVAEAAYFARNNINVPWKSNLQGVTDFQWTFGTIAALNQDYGWTNGINNLYNVFMQDFLYKEPMNNVIFIDNHDMDRIYSVLGEDLDKYKMALAMMFTQRGIPQIYYGTEILMKNYKDPSDAEVRRDFPGGFSGDTQNKFVPSGRTSREDSAYNFVRTLAQFRKNSTAIKSGKFMQYLPGDEGVYTYFRYDNQQTVMVVVNTAKAEKEIDFKKYSERTMGFTKGKNIITGEILTTDLPVKLGAKQILILELAK